MTNGFVGTATSAYVETDDGVTYIQGFNVEPNGFNLTNIRKVSQDFHKSHTKSCLRTGDVLTIQTGEIGVSTVVPEYLSGSNCHALIISRFIKSLAHPAYYCQYFNSKIGMNAFKEIETGTTMKHLNVGDMLQLLVPVPPIAEQQAIAEALLDMDTLISNLDQLIAKKRNIQQAAMQQLLTGQRRLPGFRGAWEIKQLGDIVELIMGQSPSSSNYNRHGDGLPLIQGNADIADRITIKRIFTTELTKLGKCGDILLSVRAPVGEVARAAFDVCLGRGVCAIRGGAEFLYHYLISIESSWARLSKGSTFDSINSAELRTLELRLPPTQAEQSAIATILSDMDTELTALEARREKARQLKQGMMLELLTGRIRLV
jgi:type I restriction enzyme S subunit